MFIVTVWAFLACFVVISGNLTDMRSFGTLIFRSRRERLDAGPSSSDPQGHGTQIGINTARVLRIGQSSSAVNVNNRPDAVTCEIAKRNVIESVKVPLSIWDPLIYFVFL